MRIRFAIAGLLAGLAIAACGAPAASVPPADPPARATAAAVADTRLATMYRSPTCTCCHEYEAILRRAGWTVEIEEIEDTAAFKTDQGIPSTAWSCHTLVVDGYVVEGHVPLAAIDRLLERGPAIDGIALPGMPPGSPGMDGVAAGPFEVLAIQAGATAPFGAF